MTLRPLAIVWSVALPASFCVRTGEQLDELEESAPDGPAAPQCLSAKLVRTALLQRIRFFDLRSNWRSAYFAVANFYADAENDGLPPSSHSSHVRTTLRHSLSSDDCAGIVNVPCDSHSRPQQPPKVQRGIHQVSGPGDEVLWGRGGGGVGGDVEAGEKSQKAAPVDA